MILHIINHSPFKTHDLADCLRVYRQKDSLLLIEDGVYAVLKADKLEGVRCYALIDAIDARGLRNRVSDALTLIDYDQFVDLTVEHKQLCSWY